MERRPFDVEKIAMDLVMSDDLARKKKLAKKIFDIAYKKEIYPSSIHEFYMARGRGEFGGFTVPAIKESAKQSYQLSATQLSVKGFKPITDN